MKSWNRACWTLLICGALWGGSHAVEAAESKVIRDDNWKIEIRPANRNRSAGNVKEEAPAPESVVAPQPEAPAPAPAPNAAAETKFIGPPEAHMVGANPTMTFAEAYKAIPFSRTEYMANPGYRQQAAMELMFGVLRPMTMVQQYAPRPYRYPDTYQFPYSRSDAQHINLRTFNSGYNFNGNSPFGYPYGLKGNW